MSCFIGIEWVVRSLDNDINYPVTVTLFGNEEGEFIALYDIPLNKFSELIPHMDLGFDDYSSLLNATREILEMIDDGTDWDDIVDRVDAANTRHRIAYGSLKTLSGEKYEETYPYIHRYPAPFMGSIGMIANNYIRYLLESFRPKKLWFNPPYTTVEFLDGEKVTVRAEDGTAFSKFGGFSACMLKKYCGGATEAIKLMEECEQAAKEASPSYIRQQRLEKRKIERRKRHELKVAKREAAIKEKQDELRILWEAEKRLEQEKLEKGE